MTHPKNYLMVRAIFNSIVLLVWLFEFGACNKLVTAPAPVTELSSENVYSSNSTAAAVLSGFYIGFTNGPTLSSIGGTLYRVSVEAALSADELTLYGGQTNSYPPLVQFYQN